MSDHDSDEDDLLEQAYIFRTTGKYPEGCTTNKKRSIRRKAEKLVLRNGGLYKRQKRNGTNSVSCIKWSRIGLGNYKDRAAC